MTSPNVIDMLTLYRTVLPRAEFEEICRRRQVRFGAGIYNVSVVVWLMILQRLQVKKTLLEVVQWLCQREAASLLGEGKRAREGNISPPRRRFLPSAAGLV
jgi:hypothetical protein